MQPKTLHLTNYYHRKSGGISAFYNALLRYANEHGRRMCLLVPGEQNGSEPIGSYARIYTVKAPRSPWFDRRYRLILPIGSSVRETIRILRTEQPDIIDVSDKYTLPYISGLLRKGWISGIRRPTEIAVSHERMDDMVAAYLSRRAGWFARWYIRTIYFPMFDHHIANSEYTAAELVPASKRHTTRRGIWVCPMGIDAYFVTPGPRTPHAGWRLLFAGRLAHEKNIDVLIDTMQRLPEEYSLIVAGEGPRRESFIQHAARRVPGRIHMQGHLPDRQSFVQLMRDADAFLHPNSHEPFGITPLEAMAAGLPLIAPNCGGVLTFANSRNAWLCEPTAESFANAVLAAFADHAERDNRARTARETAEQYDWSLIARRYFDLLNSLHTSFTK
jgi:glycosyltransferase involved in cell wall biosynthesis